MRRRKRLLLLTAVLAASSHAVGGRVDDPGTVLVQRLGCADGVRLTSRGAPLSQVLQQMSHTLGFELKYWGRDDPPIHWDSNRQPIELMTALAQQTNLFVRYVPDRRCAGRSRIASVHVLPVGQAAAPVRAAAAPAPRAAQANTSRAAEVRTAPTVTVAVTRPSPPAATSGAPFEYDEAQDEYMRAHGIEPPARAAPSRSGAPGAR